MRNKGLPGTNKSSLIIVGLLLVNLATSGQTRRSEAIIKDSDIKPWKTDQPGDYQASYHFSNSDLESTLELKFERGSYSAVIRSGNWKKEGDKVKWIFKFDTLNNVSIQDNKFFSDKTNGEFVKFNIPGKSLKGLMVYKPWSTWINYGTSGGYEIGFFINTGR